MNRKILIALIAIVVIIGAGLYTFSNTVTGDSQVSIDASTLEDRGNLVVDSESLDESNGLYHTDSSDVNAILVKNGGALKLVNSIINKTGDTATSGDDADFYGVNSAVLVNTNGTLEISNCEIITDSNELQLRNAPCPIFVILSGNTIFFMDSHPKKAKGSISLTPSGIIISSKALQLAKAS